MDDELDRQLLRLADSIRNLPPGGNEREGVIVAFLAVVRHVEEAGIVRERIWPLRQRAPTDLKGTTTAHPMGPVKS